MAKSLTEKEIVVKKCLDDCPFALESYLKNISCRFTHSHYYDEEIEATYDFPPDCPLHNTVFKVRKNDLLCP